MPNPKQYPEHLIPNSKLPLLTNAEIDKSHFIGVHVEEGKRLKDSDGHLNGGIIELDRIPHFSCNKIPESIPSDLNFKIHKEFNHIFLIDWIVGSDGLLPSENQFEFLENRQHYFVKISDTEYIGKYFNPVNDETVSHSFQLKVIHKPLVANYWHFEFDIKSLSDPEHIIDKNKNKWINELCSSIRAHIVTNSIFELP